jgi:hypothetical protein
MALLCVKGKCSYTVWDVNLKILYSPAENKFLSVILVFLENLQKSKDKKSALVLSVYD